jgi:hypothetical protein
MDYKKILQTVKEDLIQEGLDCFIQDEQEMSQARLLIYAGDDPQKRTQMIAIRVQAKEGDPLQLKQAGYDCISFMFEACFPFTVDDYSMSDMAQFLHFLNLQVEVPGFYLNYVDNTIIYRYVLLSEEQHIPKKIILSLIGMAMLFQDLFGQTLEKLAKGKVSFIEQMKEIANTLSK